MSRLAISSLMQMRAAPPDPMLIPWRPSMVFHLRLRCSGGMLAICCCIYACVAAICASCPAVHDLLEGLDLLTGRAFMPESAAKAGVAQLAARPQESVFSMRAFPVGLGRVGRACGQGNSLCIPPMQGKVEYPTKYVGAGRRRCGGNGGISPV